RWRARSAWRSTTSSCGSKRSWAPRRITARASPRTALCAGRPTPGRPARFPVVAGPRGRQRHPGPSPDAAGHSLDSEPPAARGGFAATWFVATAPEEIANTVLHGVGAALAVAGLAALVTLAAMRGDARHIVGCAVFGATLVAMFASSSLYHGVTSDAA